MSDELSNNTEQQPESETKELSLEEQLAERDAKLADLESQFNAVKSKSDELLQETKVAKQKAKEAAEAREQARLEKAKKEGDFEQLLQSSEKERAQLKEQLEALKSNVTKEKVKAHSLQLASELADGANAELLAEFVSKRIRYNDEGIQILDNDGNLTHNTLDELRTEFQSSEKFKSLLRGTKSSGGGAPGSTASGASKSDAIKVIDRAAFETMNHYDRASFFKNGGKIVDTL